MSLYTSDLSDLSRLFNYNTADCLFMPVNGFFTGICFDIPYEFLNNKHRTLDIDISHITDLYFDCNHFITNIFISILSNMHIFT